MKITEPAPELLRRALSGELAALDALLVSVQPGIYNLAVRMLGNRDDAADATQEILLKVTTHLAGFRGDARFSTWVFQVARNHLLTASTRSRENPEVSLEGIAERLSDGLAFADTVRDGHGEATLTPEDKLAARQVALGCTQGMLMALDREHRLAYVLDLLFGLSSEDAAQVVGITAAAYRQRLSRARSRLDAFMRGQCGLADAAAPCRCEKQLPAVATLRAREPAGTVIPLHAASATERAHVEQQYASLQRLGDAAEVLRLHPEYGAPDKLLGAIRVVLTAEGMMGRDANASRPQ